MTAVEDSRTPGASGSDASSPGTSSPGVSPPDASPPGPGEPWTILRLILWSAAYLEEKGVERGRLDAEHLLADALGTGRLQLYLQFDRPLLEEEIAPFKERLLRRARREPLQYILGRTPFRELDLRTDARALIPRPETEALVEEVLSWARGRGAHVGPQAHDDPQSHDGPRDRVLDVGTGSGCIALSLLVEGGFERAVATDPSEAALELAAENAREAGVEDRIDLRAGALYEPLAAEERFDAVVSNPPYVAEGERSELEPEVGQWEPAEALFAGDDGLAVIRELIRGAPGRLRSGGLLALEVGLGQAGAVADAIRDAGSFTEPRIRRDLTGRERIVTAERTEQPSAS